MGKTAATLMVVVLVAAVGGGVGKAQPSRTQTALRVTRIGSLPQAVAKSAAAALPGGRLMVLGGYAGGRSLKTILAGRPRRLRRFGRLPLPTHDAAAAVVHGSVYLFGGGASFAMPSVVRINPITSQAKEAPALDEPLSDLGAVTIGRHIYLVGGYTGAQFASAILRYNRHGGTSTVGRLPQPTRYAGVARLGLTIYLAGGLTPARRQALPRGRRLRPRDRSGLREGLARGSAAGFALRSDGDHGRPAHRRDRWRDERRLGIVPRLDDFSRKLPYARMLTARAATRSTVTTESMDSAAINALASRVSGNASVGVNAVAFVREM
jgi:hypothetical protein